MPDIRNAAPQAALPGTIETAWYGFGRGATGLGGERFFDLNRSPSDHRGVFAAIGFACFMSWGRASAQPKP